MVFTVNEWGIDDNGILADFFEKKRIFHINWSVDDPFFEELFIKKKFRQSVFRIDFVSDKDYLPQMKNTGYNVFFLPLGTDPTVFMPADTGYERDVLFAGNSYTLQIEDFLKGYEEYFLEIVPCFADIINKYNHDNMFNVESGIEIELKKQELPVGGSIDKIKFIAKQFIGFMYRKQIVESLVKNLKSFTIVGDNGWKMIDKNINIGKSGYYDGLCKFYTQSKINVDINRMVIRNGFTQRVFDTCACNCFCITSYKPIVGEYFDLDSDKKELVAFRCKEELHDLIKYYLKHDTQRNAVIERGHKKVIENHTYNHRMNDIFRVFTDYLK
jgi:spore maturation protein CgeB